MQPINFPGAQVVGKPPSMTDEECMSVYAMAMIDASGFGCFLECWKPSYEDIQAINRGEPIWIRIFSTGIPPISIYTMNEKGECNDAT